MLRRDSTTPFSSERFIVEPTTNRFGLPSSSRAERWSATDVCLQYVMEAIMRRYFVLSLGSVLAGAMLVSVAAADPYFRRVQNGSWTNVEYNGRRLSVLLLPQLL